MANKNTPSQDSEIVSLLISHENDTVRSILIQDIRVKYGKKAIINLSKPMFGASFTVNIEAAWSLLNQCDGGVEPTQLIHYQDIPTIKRVVLGLKCPIFASK